MDKFTLPLNNSDFGLTPWLRTTTLLLLLFPFSELEAARIGKNFDHFTTQFLLNGAHQRVRCDVCHRRGVFKGTPKKCASCHGAGSRVASSKMPSTHITTSQSCDNCHKENRWSGARMDHSTITKPCAQCHNGRHAQGKSTRHVSSSNRCGDCHRTATWRGARFNHDTISANCSRCHNGSTARGKSPSHLQTRASCDACHSTRAWRPARFTHDGIIAGCSKCHNGIQARGKSAKHIATSAGCENCHTTRAWRPANFSHDNVAAGSCANCHNGTSAKGKSSGHFITSLQCDSCHRTRAWKPAQYRHGGNYPDHGSRLRCKNCHSSNNSTIQWKNPALRPDCAGCHANDYEPKKHKNASVTALKNCAGSCHKSKPEHSARKSGW